MSKAKYKNKIGTANKSKHEPKQKRKWTKMKDFNYLRPIKWLPGFRTAKHWKRIVAILYFSTTPTAFFLSFMGLEYFGAFVFVSLITLPFIICSFAKFMETKNSYYAKEALIAAFLFGCDNIALTIYIRQALTSLPE